MHGSETQFCDDLRRSFAANQFSSWAGHLTQTVFSKARSVVGVDISDVAIARARSLSLRNARFEIGDFFETSFEGSDVIAAIECIYYLSHQEQGAFFKKVATCQSACKYFKRIGGIAARPDTFADF